MDWHPELQAAILKQLSQYEFICRRTGIEWEDFDYRLSIESMLADRASREAA
jgi:hypothetical protein